jgi:hypothetical protein
MDGMAEEKRGNDFLGIREVRLMKVGMLSRSANFGDRKEEGWAKQPAGGFQFLRKVMQIVFECENAAGKAF